MKLPEPIEKLSQMKHAKVIGILSAIAANLALLIVAVNIDPNLGYYLMMVGFVAITFIVPYIFGWRDGKTLAVMGVGMFLLLGAINGPLVVNKAFGTPQDEPVSSNMHVVWFTRAYTEIEDGNYTASNAWYRLEQGTVDIYKGSPGQTYTFRVTYYSNDTAPPDMRFGYAKGIMGVQGAPLMTEADASDLNYIDGKEYIYTMSVAEAGIYSHWFAAVFGTGTDTNSLNTTVALGPLVGSQTDNWGMYIPIGAASMFCNIGLLFLIIVLLYWWLGTAKAKRKVWDEALREKEEEAVKDDKTQDDALESKPFTCDQCGAAVGAEDNFCPKCGDRFDGEEDGKPSDKPAGKEEA